MQCIAVYLANHHPARLQVYQYLMPNSGPEMSQVYREMMDSNDFSREAKGPLTDYCMSFLSAETLKRLNGYSLSELLNRYAEQPASIIPKLFSQEEIDRYAKNIGDGGMDTLQKAIQDEKIIEAGTLLSLTSDECLKELLSRTNDANENALILAVKKAYISIVISIIEKAKTPEQRLAMLKQCDSEGLTPLTRAVMANNGDQIINALLGAIPQENILGILSQRLPQWLEERHGGGQPVLHFAAHQNFIIPITAILNSIPVELLAGALTKQNDEGETPLCLAVRKNHEQIVKFILSKSNDFEMLTKPDNTGKTPLHKAVSRARGHANKAVITAILNAIPAEKMDEVLNMVDKDGNTALSLAIKNGHHDLANLLLSKVSNENLVTHLSIRDKDTEEETGGCTPLLNAARYGALDVIKAIFDRTSDPRVIRATDGIGNTALHHAVSQHDNVALVSTIANKFSDKAMIYAKNNEEKTAADLAFKCKNEKVIKFFCNQGGLLSYYLAQAANPDDWSGSPYYVEKAKSLLDKHFSIRLISSDVLRMADDKGYTTIIQSIKQTLTNDYFNNHANPLIKMYMRFVDFKFLKGNRDAQFNHFTQILTAFENEDNKLERKDFKKELNQVMPYHEFSSTKQLYKDLENMLRQSSTDELQEYYEEFTSLRELLEKEHETLDLGFFLEKRHVSVLSQITQELTPAPVSRVDRGGPST